MTDDPTPLETTRATVARWPGWRVTDPLRDDAGTWGFYAVHDTEPFLCVVKRRLHDRRASFMREAVDRAKRDDAVLCEFVTARYAAEKPTLDAGYCFDPATVAARGEASVGDSAKGVRTEWVEISIRHGVLLGEHVSGRAALVPPGGVEAGQVTFEVQ